MELIQKAVEFARQVFSEDCGGHDLDHTLRVYRMALHLAEAEGADLEIAALAALLHDVDDRKVSPQTSENLDRASHFLWSNGVSEEMFRRVILIIYEISFSQGHRVPETLEGKCVQDADRLDAMGAIGIARTFAYGGSKGRRMHDPAGRDPLTSVNHFHEKLLKLAELMNTDSAREIARERHRYMEEYLERFQREWDGNI
ncbi:MAG: HD domain-containing protein [Oscillospiraceae bacterium]|nr:HD domain-containing protein [Oscillospiraceae bacterium]